MILQYVLVILVCVASFILGYKYLKRRSDKKEIELVKATCGEIENLKAYCAQNNLQIPGFYPNGQHPLFYLIEGKMGEYDENKPNADLEKLLEHISVTLSHLRVHYYASQSKVTKLRMDALGKIQSLILD